MSTSKKKTISARHNILQNSKLRIPYLFLPFVFLVLLSCNSDKKIKKIKEIENISSNTIEIVTEVMDFQTVDTIPSGWNTFKYINNSTETHFFLFDKYPVGKTLKDT